MENGEITAPISETSEDPPGMELNRLSLVDKKPDVRAAGLDFKDQYFPQTSVQEWNNWRWQMSHSITNSHRLEEIFGLQLNKKELIHRKLPFRITPYYAGVALGSALLRKTVIPSLDELVVSRGESVDPLSEDHDRPVHCILHRYPDRVLFLSTSFCFTNCRYCTRSRIVANKNFIKKQMREWDEACQYIHSHPRIRDVVISGGDPLTLPDFSIDYLLSRIFSIPHVEMVRIGTKSPVVLPMRINKPLLKIFKKYKPLYMSVHFIHPDELTPAVRSACDQIAGSGVVMGSQTVLLKGVNDDPETLRRLFHGLLKVRVRPYYLYQCDPIMGSLHFRTTIEKGIEIIENLRGWTSGYAVPHYVVDAPGGGGKIPLLPDYYCGKDAEGNVRLRNYEQNHYLYPDDLNDS